MSLGYDMKNNKIIDKAIKILDYSSELYKLTNYANELYQKAMSSRNNYEKMSYINMIKKIKEEAKILFREGKLSRSDISILNKSIDMNLKNIK